MTSTYIDKYYVSMGFYVKLRNRDEGWKEAR